VEVGVAREKPLQAKIREGDWAQKLSGSLMLNIALPCLAL